MAHHTDDPQLQHDLYKCHMYLRVSGSVRVCVNMHFIYEHIDLLLSLRKA